MTLYEIGAQYQAILSRDPQDEGEAQDMIAELDAIEGEYTAKIEACVYATRNIDAEADAIRTEEKRLTARRHALEAKSMRLMDYIAEGMRTHGDAELKAGIFNLRFRKGTGRVNVTDINYLPPEYVRYEPKVLTADINAALKAGVSVPGAELIYDEKLQIK